ncbi:MAG: DUF4142 domain-containing protein [Chthoniobacterales bacterium]
MKNKLSFISRLTALALATAGLCFGPSAFAQSTAPDKGPEPGRVGSMAPVGAKPSKAELAKMEAEKASAKPAAGAAKTSAKLDGQDSAFIMEAAKGGMMEVEMSKMAAKMAKSPEVQKLAKMMVAEHSQANSELMGLAKAKGVKLPAPAKMAKMSTDNFDSVYLTDMMKDHQKTIALFEKQAKNGKDADTKNWANKMLPALKKHLQAIKKAQGSMKAG